MTRRQFTHALLAASGARPSSQSSPDQRLQLWTRDSIQWQPNDPPGARYAVLAGDRSRACSIFTYAFELPGRVWAPAHYHSQDAHVCVIEGTLLIGLGMTSDRSRVTRVNTGEVFIVPAGQAHFEGSEGRCVIIGSALGGWTTHIVEK